MLEASVRRDPAGRDLRFLESLRETLAGCRDLVSIYSSAVHRLAAAFDVDTACLAAYEPVSGALELVHQAGMKQAWDTELLLRAVREGRMVNAEGTLAVPVLYGDIPERDGASGHLAARRLWGVLGVARSSLDGRNGQTYTSSERQTLRGAADRIGSELERRRVALLDDVLDSLLRKAKPIDVYTHTLRELRRFLRYDHSASVMTMQRGMSQLTVRVEKVVVPRGPTDTLVDSARRGRPLRLTAQQTRYLNRLREPVELTNDGSGWRTSTEQQDPESRGLWRVLCLGTGSEEGSILCYPLVFGGQMHGVLRLAARRPGAFDPIAVHAHVLERFARLLSVTLYRSELYHQSDRQLQAIKEIGRAITSPMPVEEICRRVLQLALRILHVDVGAVGLLREDGALELVAYQGCTLAEPPAIRIGEGISGAVVQTGASRAVPDVKREPEYVVFNTRVCSELVAPIIYDQEVIGFIDVESYEQGRFREENEEVITFLEALANQAAIAIKASQMRQEIVERLGPSMAIDPGLTAAGLQDLLIEELQGKIEELAAANRAKSEFLAHMSHDLRGPLNVIVGLSNLLVNPEVAPTLNDEKRRESLELIRSNGEVLSSLIGNILDLSAVEAGRAEINLETLNAASIFGYLGQVARTLAKESGKDLEISVTVDPLISQITVDEGKFMRIMHNLISNAVKFTPPGGQISIMARPGTVDRTSLYVAVSDTGIGIATEDHDRVFQAFHQVDSPVARQYHGTGLGLTVVSQLVELHGGRVWLESAPGKGSTFHVMLSGAIQRADTPAEITDGRTSETVTPAGSSGGLVPVRRRLSVLVVEDIPAQMDMMRLAVTARGHSMHGVTSGEAALAWLEKNRPDVILLDMQLPGIDGFEVAGRIKSRVETHTIPVIAVSADALSVTEDRALASGCDAYLTKPVDIATLLTAIDELTGVRIRPPGEEPARRSHG